MISTLLSPFAVTNPYVADLYPDQYKLPREAGSWLRAGVESLSTPPPKRQGCNAQLPTPCCSSRSLLAGGARWTSQCAHEGADVAFCPLGTPYGDVRRAPQRPPRFASCVPCAQANAPRLRPRQVGWPPHEGFCGMHQASGSVCAQCECCCPMNGAPASGLEGTCASTKRLPVTHESVTYEPPAMWSRPTPSPAP
jgi:hypothetical protein